MSMISIGGVIGAGLFVGSGAVIHSTGPGSVISYALAGLLVVFVMRMLGEMAAARPSSGSFSAYARESIGPWAGYTIGWLYWFFWVIVIAVEATAGAGILKYWIHDAPLWLMSLILTILLTLTNVYSVKSFGEFEYWFSLIKVISISLFILLGAAVILGVFPGTHAPGLSNLTGRGGFMPAGLDSALLGITVVIFSFMGTEIVAIAAGESGEAAKAVRVATNSVIWRILLFYIGSIAIVVTMLPWNAANVMKSPFVAVLEHVGVSSAAQIMNLIILTAVLSCLNSGLYTNSRMLYGMAQRGDAPRAFMKLNKNGVPVRAILFGTVFAYIGVIFSYVSPDTVFLFLVNASGGVALLVYLVIAFSHLRMRRKLERERSDLPVKMWLFPWLVDDRCDHRHPRRDVFRSFFPVSGVPDAAGGGPRHRFLLPQATQATSRQKRFSEGGERMTGCGTGNGCPSRVAFSGCGKKKGTSRHHGPTTVTRVSVRAEWKASVDRMDDGGGSVGGTGGAGGPG